jgi:hypothetical protein
MQQRESGLCFTIFLSKKHKIADDSTATEAKKINKLVISFLKNLEKLLFSFY